MLRTTAIAGVLATTALVSGVTAPTSYAADPTTDRTSSARPTVDTAEVQRTTAEAQKRLNAIGCDAGTVDGSYGDHAKAAVVRFQAANRLTQSATLNDATWDKLLSSTKVACNKRPVVANSGSGRRIVVSRTQNYVWLVNSDGTVRHQGGMIDNPSEWAAGTYMMGSKCGRPAHILHNSDYEGGLTLDYFSRLQTNLCGVAFHRVPRYKGTQTQIHPNWLLGTNFRQSHGCMRVSMATAQAIWDFSQVSTKVVVKS